MHYLIVHCARFGLKDPAHQNLIQQIHTGFLSSQNKLGEELRPHWQMHNNLSFTDDIIFIDRRIVIPGKLQKAVLEHLHIGHQGITTMKLRANQSVYWPGLTVP